MNLGLFFGNALFSECQFTAGTFYSFCWQDAAVTTEHCRPLKCGKTIWLWMFSPLCLMFLPFSFHSAKWLGLGLGLLILRFSGFLMLNTEVVSSDFSCLFSQKCRFWRSHFSFLRTSGVRQVFIHVFSCWCFQSWLLFLHTCNWWECFALRCVHSQPLLCKSNLQALGTEVVGAAAALVGGEVSRAPPGVATALTEDYTRFAPGEGLGLCLVLRMLYE